ncbi:MAG: hypothetical protein GXO49_06910 [Chlorobi bacterium]|nr:hypothetical protein [Chlorobiota bacterium]
MIVVFLYYPAFHGTFVFDDFPNIVNNYETMLKNLSFSSLWQALTSTHGGIRPFAHLSFALNYYFFGLDPFYYHLINIFIHIVNSILVYFLLKDIYLNFYNDENYLLVSSFGSVLFSIATIQTSAVSYIVQRMALGMTLFSLLTLLMFMKKRYVTAFVFWLIALGFKENAALIPFIILLYLWVVRNKSKVVFGVSCVVVVLLVMLFLFSPMLNFYDKIVNGYAHRPFTLTERLLTEPRVILHYFSLILFPLYSRFSLHYGFTLSANLFTPVSTFFSILILLFVFLYGVISKNKWLSFWILFIFITLSLESSIIPLDIAYEHRMYFPMVGVSAVFGYLVAIFKNKKIVYGVAVFFLLFSAFNTFVRNMQFRSYETILLQDYKNYPTNSRMLHNLFAIYLKKGEKNKSYFYLCKSLENNSFYYNDYIDFANLIVEKSSIDDGIRYLKNTFKTKRKINKPYLILWKIAKLYEKKEDFKRAEQYYLLALKIQKKSVKVFRDYGLLLFNTGHYKKGYEYMKKAYNINKQEPIVRYYLKEMEQVQIFLR